MIRRARPDDVPVMVEMGRAFHAEAGWPDVIAWDDAGAGAALASMAEAGEHVMLVAEDDGVVVAMAAAVICPTWFNPAVLSAQEWFWYVRPGARRGVGRDMLEALEAAVAAAGARTFTMLAVENLRADALARLYRGRGYRPGERTFIRRL